MLISVFHCGGNIELSTGEVPCLTGDYKSEQTDQRKCQVFI